MPVSQRPGNQLSFRPLHFIWIVDCSSSMRSNKKMATLNKAIRDVITPMRVVADANPNADVLIRVLKFSSGAQWQVEEPTPINNFQWEDLHAEGVTDLGRALLRLADALKIPPMPNRALPPILVLISDGRPTDDYQSGLKELLDQPWGRKAVRIAIAIGEDADYDVLKFYVGNSELKPLQANNAETLIYCIKWASTVVLKSVSLIPDNNVSGSKVPIPVPVNQTSSSSQDTW